MFKKRVCHCTQRWKTTFNHHDYFTRPTKKEEDDYENSWQKLKTWNFKVTLYNLHLVSNQFNKNVVEGEARFEHTLFVVYSYTLYSWHIKNINVIVIHFNYSVQSNNNMDQIDMGMRYLAVNYNWPMTQSCWEYNSMHHRCNSKIYVQYFHSLILAIFPFWIITQIWYTEPRDFPPSAN